MVEYAIDIDAVFASLADAVRRDILKRVMRKSQSVSALVEAYTQMSLAAVAKHIAVLERARLVIKTRQGRQQMISANPKALQVAAATLEAYRVVWDKRLDKLDDLLQ